MGEARYPWAAGMRVCGLPYADVSGASRYDDLKHPVWPGAWAK